MTFPPLPEPTIVDGRRLYTAGDMRLYGRICADAAIGTAPVEPESPEIAGQYSSAVKDLFGRFGMTP